MNKFIIIALFSFLVACSAPKSSREIDSEGFHQFYEEQGRCVQLIDQLLDPAVESMSNLDQVSDMRQWVLKNTDNELAMFFQKIREEKAKSIVLDPTSERDYSIVYRWMHSELVSKYSGGSRECDRPDSPELFADSLYRRLGGGRNAEFEKALSERGVTGRGAKIRFLMVTLVADELESY